MPTDPTPQPTNDPLNRIITTTYDGTGRITPLSSVPLTVGWTCNMSGPVMSTEYTGPSLPPTPPAPDEPPDEPHIVE